MHFSLPGLPFSNCFTTEFTGIESLLPGELPYIRQAGKKRVLDFCTGRFCARKALEPLGFTHPEIQKGPGKEPIWPGNITGSISHSRELAGAIVAHKSETLSLGLDIETLGGVNQELWEALFTFNEQGFLTSIASGQAELFSTLFFSVKESFYKFQYPLTRQFLDFKDTEIRYVQGNFSIALRPGITSLPFSPSSLTIHWQQWNNQVITVCYR